MGRELNKLSDPRESNLVASLYVLGLILLIIAHLTALQTSPV